MRHPSLSTHTSTRWSTKANPVTLPMKVHPGQLEPAAESNLRKCAASTTEDMLSGSVAKQQIRARQKATLRVTTMSGTRPSNSSASTSATSFSPRAKQRETVIATAIYNREQDEVWQHRGRKAVAGDLDVDIRKLMQRSRSDTLRAMAKRKVAAFVEGRFMLVTSVIITIYALVGDDLRLVCTNKPMDNWFNAIALVCLVFFSVEIILSSISKPDYFLGFFFILDLVATLSIILDLTWVYNELLSDEDLSMEQARSGRTARLGATIGRVVRVLRLIRIVKLYKAYFEKVASGGKRASKAMGPGEGQAHFMDDLDDGEWDNVDGEEDQQMHQESIVGKKLVSLTTRRVIILVLVMLLVLPHLRVDMSLINSSSAAWGADSVWEAFRQMEQNASKRGTYEDRLLTYIYYHNWFTGNAGCPGESECSHTFMTHAFWIGLAGQDPRALRNRARLAAISESSLDQWEQAVSQQRPLLYDLGRVPPEARSLLSSPWTVSCSYAGLEHLGISLLEREIEGVVGHRVRCPEDLRPQEKKRVHPQLITRSQFDDWHFVFFFDARPFVREESRMSLGATFFICVVLCISTLFFSKDANSLVLNPVERMVEKVKTIANDPLIAMKMADAEFEFQMAKQHKLHKHRNRTLSWLMERWDRLNQSLPWADRGMQQPLETAILEKTIIKLGSLLALGFGEAGANIVSHNMRGLHTSGVNAMVPGSRVDCIIGIAKIRNFSSATEALHGKVLTFVNQIAEIVHGIVNEFHGAANKNNGETFLIIWRAQGFDPGKQTRLADMSMITFARILGAVHQSPVLARYREHPGLQHLLGSRCHVNLSFGLHFGWAIEGAVGSEFKIDASYISPNVSIAGSLEQATRIYDVSLIASETVIRLCSKALAAKCRLIDKVIIKGSVTPLELHVLDLDFAALEVHQPRSKIPWNMRQRFRARQLLEMEKNGKWADDLVIVELFENSPDVVMMRQRYDEEFLQHFKMGYHNYSEGEWETARGFLSTTCEMLGIKDGPSRELLRFMEAKHNFVAPVNWRGVHQLEGHAPNGGA